MSSRLVLGVRWGKWLEAPAWLPAGAAPADCLNDFRATDSELSVFLVPSDADPEQAAIALAGTRQKFERYGYIVFSTDVVTALGIGGAVTLGDTPDPVVD